MQIWMNEWMNEWMNPSQNHSDILLQIIDISVSQNMVGKILIL